MSAARPTCSSEYEARCVRHGYRADTVAAACRRRASTTCARACAAQTTARRQLLGRSARLRRVSGARSAGRRARHLPLGRRRPRQDVPDGPVPRARRRAVAARALPPLHEGRARAPAANCATSATRSSTWPRTSRATRACCAWTNCSSATSPTRCCCGGLFAGLFERGVTLVFTSNLPPSRTLPRRAAAPALPAGHRR